MFSRRIEILTSSLNLLQRRKTEVWIEDIVRGSKKEVDGIEDIVRVFFVFASYLPRPIGGVGIGRGK